MEHALGPVRGDVDAKWLKAYSLLPNAQQAFIGQAKELNTLAEAIEMPYK